MSEEDTYTVGLSAFFIDDNKQTEEKIGQRRDYLRSRE